MIEEHNSFEVENFGKEVRDVLQGRYEVKEYPNLQKTKDKTDQDVAFVFATVISISIDSDNYKLPIEHTIVVKAVMDILMENPNCFGIQSIDGNIIAVMDTPFTSDIDAALDSVGKINALFNIVNKQHRIHRLPSVNKGIGMCYGRILYGISKKKDKHNNVWSGSVVKDALRYSREAVSEGTRVFANFTIYNNLKDDYKKLFEKTTNERYVAYPVNIAMNSWIDSNI